MKYLSLTAVFCFTVLYMYFLSQSYNEPFVPVTNEKVVIESVSNPGMSFSVCKFDKEMFLCLSNKQATSFSPLVFEKDLLALEYQGHYVSVCDVKDCDNDVKFDVFHPYSHLSKLKLIPTANVNEYIIQFFDSTYLAKHPIYSHIIRVPEKQKALKVRFKKLE